MTPIRVLIADDHALFREGVRALLLSTPDIDCVGEAGDGIQAVQQAHQLSPDVILMDIHMPELDGIEATRRILKNSSNTHIIMVTMLDNDASVFAAMRAGALGYVLKGANHDEMLESIRAAAKGQALFGSDIASRILGFFKQLQDYQGTPPPNADAPFPELTEREREVLDLIARGKNNQDISNILVISPNTVRNHITNIFSKLQVADRSEAIIRAREAGYGTKRGG